VKENKRRSTPFGILKAILNPQLRVVPDLQSTSQSNSQLSHSIIPPQTRSSRFPSTMDQQVQVPDPAADQGIPTATATMQPESNGVVPPPANSISAGTCASHSPQLITC
jgi:hypothetical protein